MRVDKIETWKVTDTSSGKVVFEDNSEDSCYNFIKGYKYAVRRDVARSICHVCANLSKTVGVGDLEPSYGIRTCSEYSPRGVLCSNFERKKVE